MFFIMFFTLWITGFFLKCFFFFKMKVSILVKIIQKFDCLYLAVANREDIEDREAFARKLLQMYKDDSLHSTKFSTDRGYATSIDMNIYLWKEDIEDGESVMTAEYRPVEYGKDYDVVNNPDKFQLYIDGKEVEE